MTDPIDLVKCNFPHLLTRPHNDLLSTRGQLVHRKTYVDSSRNTAICRINISLLLSMNLTLPSRAHPRAHPGSAVPIVK